MKLLLDQYLDGALDALDRIGVDIFANDYKTRNRDSVSLRKAKSSTENTTLSKKDTVRALLLDKGITLPNNFSLASQSAKNHEYWINPKTTIIDEDWVIVLRDQFKNEVIVLEIPKHTLHSQKHGQKNGGIYIRKDKPTVLDVHIDVNTMIDRVSKIDFSRYIVHRVKY